MKGLLFTYSATYGGAVVSLFYPYVGFLIYVCFSIIKPPSMWYWANLQGGNFDRIVAVAMILGWIIKGTGTWKLGRASGTMLALLAFFFWGIVGWACSDIPALGQLYVVQQAKIVLPFIIGLTLMDSTAKLRQLAWVIVLSIGYLAYELNVSYYAGLNRVARDGFAGMDNNCVAVQMAVGVGMAMFLGFGEKRLWMKAIALVSAVLMAHTIMFSWSRGGMVALCVVGLSSFVLIRREPKHYLMLLLLVALAFRLAGDQVRERFMTVFVDPKERDASASTRLEYWGYCLDAMKRSPVLGVGPGHWFEECDRRNVKRIYAHSVWMQAGAELGVPGLALLLLFYGLTVKRLYGLTKRRAHVADPWFPDAARMVIAAVVGYAVAGTFVSLVSLETPYYIVLLGAGVLKMNSLLPRPEAGEPLLEEPLEEPQPVLA